MRIINYVKKKIYNLSIKDMKMGENSYINMGTIIHNPNNIEIGNNSYINGGMIIAGEHSKIIIGNDCLISYNVHIRTTTHNYINKRVLIRNQGHSEKNIVIEDDVWVGYGAQIMPGVTLHKGCVIGAGAVVTKDVEEYAIVVGVPAKVIKYRNEND